MWRLLVYYQGSAVVWVDRDVNRPVSIARVVFDAAVRFNTAIDDVSVGCEALDK